MKEFENVIAEAHGIYNKELKTINRGMLDTNERIKTLTIQSQYINNVATMSRYDKDILFPGYSYSQLEDRRKANYFQTRLNETIAQNKQFTVQQAFISDPQYFTKLVEKIKIDREYRKQKQSVKKEILDKILQSKPKPTSESEKEYLISLKPLVARILKGSLKTIDEANDEDKEKLLEELTSENSITQILTKANEELNIKNENEAKKTEAIKNINEMKEAEKKAKEEDKEKRKKPKSALELEQFRLEKKEKKKKDDFLTEARGLYNKEIKNTNTQLQKQLKEINYLNEEIYFLRPNQKIKNILGDILDGHPTREFQRMSEEKEFNKQIIELNENNIQLKEKITKLNENNIQLKEKITKLNEPDALNQFIEIAKRNVEECAIKKALNNVQKIREAAIPSTSTVANNILKNN